MWVEEEVKKHEIVKSMKGDHLWPDGWKGRLGISSPSLGREVSRRRDVPDRRVQFHIVRWGECDPAIDDVLGQHLLLLNLHPALEDKVLLNVKGEGCNVSSKTNIHGRPIFLFLDDGLEEIMRVDESGGIFECWGIASVELSLRWEDDLDPPTTSESPGLG